MAQASQSSREEVLAAALDDIELKIAFRRQQKIILHYHAMYYIISPAKKAKTLQRAIGYPVCRAAEQRGYVVSASREYRWGPAGGWK